MTTYWNVFEDGDVADRQRGPGFADWSDTVTVAANRAICATARTFGDTCVDLYAPFLSADGNRNPTPLLSSDGDHPNAAGHDVIARALLAATPTERAPVTTEPHPGVGDRGPRPTGWSGSRWAERKSRAARHEGRPRREVVATAGDDHGRHGHRCVHQGDEPAGVAEPRASDLVRYRSWRTARPAVAG